MTNLKECLIIDFINLTSSKHVIITRCDKFLFGISGYCIFKYNLETKCYYRIAGSKYQGEFKDGTRDEAMFHSPLGLTLSTDLKTLYIADHDNCAIRAICVQTGITSTVYTQQTVLNPSLISLSPNGQKLIVSNNFKIMSICITTGKVDTIFNINFGFNQYLFIPDGKHIYINDKLRILKHCFATKQNTIILSHNGIGECKLSKDGQILFVSLKDEKFILVIDTVTNEVIDKIILDFVSKILFISHNQQHMYIHRNRNVNNQLLIIDISKYFIDLQTFTRIQMSKYSYLSQPVIKRVIK